MALVVNTIGTSSRNYSTPAAWEASLPANFVTAGNSYEGDCYNDSEFTATGRVIAFSAHTTDATHTLTLTAASGQSFQDNAGVRTNALTYNVSNGVGFRSTGAYGSGPMSATSFIDYLIITRLQLSTSSANSAGTGIQLDNADHLIFKDNIVYSINATVSPMMSVNYNITNAINVVNTLFIMNSAATGPCLLGTGFVTACTFVKPSNLSATGSGITVLSYRNYQFNSCVFMGFSAAVVLQASGSTTGSTNNATNLSTFGTSVTSTSSQTSVTYSSATPFTNAANSALDLRSISGTPLAANGLLNATLAPNDISGTTRSNPPTIGVWELSGAAPIIFNAPFFGTT